MGLDGVALQVPYATDLKEALLARLVNEIPASKSSTCENC